MRQELMTKDHEVYSRIICSLVELEYIQQSLDNQDEVDKHNTNLFGLSETNMSIEELLQKGGFQELIARRQNQQSLNTAFLVKPDCLTCSSDEMNRGLVMKAFKMACIDYKTHDVTFRGLKFTRRTLFQIRRKLIDEEWRSVLADK